MKPKNFEPESGSMKKLISKTPAFFFILQFLLIFFVPHSKTLAASDSVNLSEITVTTTSLGQDTNIEDVQASIEVVDKIEIEKSNARSVPQLLNNAKGIEIKDSGSTSSISIRGFDENHTLILVDGLRRTGKYGSSDLSTIQLDDIERVEIVRGPMSALYGADGIAGVVNIITQKDYAEDYTKIGLLGGAADNGERGTYISTINGALTKEKMTHNYSIELRNKEDYRFDKSSTATDLKNESRQFLSYSNRFRIDKNNKIFARLEYSRQDDEGRNFLNNDTYEKEDRYQLSAHYNHTNEKNYGFDSNLAYGYSDTKVNRGSGLETTDYKQFEFNNYFRHFTTEKMTNILGAGYKNEEIEVSIYTREASRDNYNLLFQNEYSITDTLTSNLGIRHDSFSDFGDSVTPKASLLYKPSNYSLRASYGESFKAPSFTNMYSHFTRSAGPITYDISGNPNLQPEESKTYELALNYRMSKFNIEVIHHRTKLENLINSYTVSFNPITRTNFTSYRNIDNASINGTEISMHYDFDFGLGVDLSWEYLDTKDEATNERLTGSAKTTFKTDLSYEIKSLGFYLFVKRYQSYYGTDENRNNVTSDYTIADLKINYKISGTWEWFCGIDNIQDKQMPYNMTSRGTPNDPGERFYYSGINVYF